MEVVQDYEALEGSQNKIVIKKLALTAEGVMRTFPFHSSCGMRPQVSAENGLNLDKGQIPYQQILTVLTVAVVEYAHLYSYCVEKIKIAFRIDRSSRP